MRKMLNMKIHKRTIKLFLLLLCLAPTLSTSTLVFAQGPTRIELTQKTYSEKIDLNKAVKKELGDNYSLADWNDLKAIKNIGEWIQSVHLKDGWTFMLTNAGKTSFSNRRQYFVLYTTKGAPPTGFLAHDKIGNKLFLGSWFDLNAHILALKKGNDDHGTPPPVIGKPGDGCGILMLTRNAYSEKENLGRAITKELGYTYSIADWNDLKSIRDINQWVSCMGLKKGQTFMVAKNGELKFNKSNRQYFVLFSPSGVPAGFLVHEKIGTSLFLGSWYGENRNILAKKNK